MIIYDEEEDVSEIYFILEGVVGIAFSLSADLTGKQYSIGKQLKSFTNTTRSHIVCDHYVTNQCKSQFIYLAVDTEVKCLALLGNHLHENVFPKYPDIMKKLQSDSFELYFKNIFVPLNAMR